MKIRANKNKNICINKKLCYLIAYRNILVDEAHKSLKKSANFNELLNQIFITPYYMNS